MTECCNQKFDKVECGRRDSNSHGLTSGGKRQSPAAPKAAVYASFTTPARRVVGAGWNREG